MEKKILSAKVLLGSPQYDKRFSNLLSLVYKLTKHLRIRNHQKHYNRNKYLANRRLDKMEISRDITIIFNQM